ncbi:NAD-glutamate dehydrogenase [Nocardioides zeae]|uniref:NAD-glutamate dehydrogenase n=1 Tax=Nocardioides imazamoxiresistens TaxID=3231893 RepID=A0ABU3PRW7_9ACTN|nr:NAD-glutamate dehydrogenase [Nocardioides zeae]MDT9591977.1 NAD-glutamate dehydrogenase [Nocardioides zeae]
MATTLDGRDLDRSKSDLVAEAATHARSRPDVLGGPERTADVSALLAAYFRHVAPEDILDRTPVDVFGAAASHHRAGATRLPGETVVRIATPSVADDGWTAEGHTVVEVVTDDMPFLVDSVTMELDRQGRDVHVVLHPRFEVRRDADGALLDVRPVAEGAVGRHDEPEQTDDDVTTARESWMHVEIGRLSDDPEDAPEVIEESLRKVLADVRAAVDDWKPMRAAVEGIATDLAERPEEVAPGIDAATVRRGADLLAWLADDHFTLLGYREYRLVPDGGAEADGADGGNAEDLLEAVPGTGLGILRQAPGGPTDASRLTPEVRARLRDPELLVLAKANSRSTVHRPAYLDYVGVKTFGPDGEVTGERRILGLFSSAAYTESLTRIPLVRDKAAAVMERLGYDQKSHAGKNLLDTLENLPRDELFQTSVDDLTPIAEAVTYARERRRQLRLFVRRDTYGRYLSVLVYLPHDRYSTAVRERFTAVLRDRLHSDAIEYAVRLSDSAMVRVHFVVRPRTGLGIEEATRGFVADLEHRFDEAARSWRDDLRAALIAEHGEVDGARLARAYAGAFPEAYKEDFDTRVAAADVGRLEQVRASGDGAQGIDASLHRPVGAARGEAMLKIFRVGPPLSLSSVLPMISSMGVEVLDERPYTLEGLDEPTHVYEFALRVDGEVSAESRDLFAGALRAVWDDRAEVDPFNVLVLRAGLTWRQVSVLRAYGRYMRQGSSPFSTSTMAAALAANVDITRALLALFEARFDPDLHVDDPEGREAAQEELAERIRGALDEVESLDHDRILRAYLTHVRASLRTSYFQRADSGATRAHLALKLQPSAIPDLPAPRPTFEIFVYSPRVEGVHLRFGAVARGGLRWSDRRDDFRTEILGLVKAQMVKNTVIVPVGAKGGFYAKRLPPVDPSRPADREAWLAEGVAAYRTFISGLLDVTDNLVEGPEGREVVPPQRVVRHDGDDTYLVVAADKGTATFSDIANQLSADYGFWLGDAFASGGSVGYDHKAMGITARGAWVSVRRHFRELGLDTQAEEFTVAGIGDMSGDVFGNGMLCSPHIRLVAAFDHRDIFLDPDPDPAASFAERQRLFDLPRSSWRDYDTALISEGGGVHSRSAKSVPVTEQVRRVLGLADDVTALPPNDLLRAILRAPVDLLWNGGIGTYVKSSRETHADVGDKANDVIRVDGADLRARVVAEGGNLGLTQLGRVEYSETGGRINTDFIDNSAGVDTSDREVNIKILLDRVVAAGDLTGKQRNELLASMTDEVASLVLHDNYEQNLALANAVTNAPSLLHVHESWMRHLESEGIIDRTLEALPSRAEVRRRLEEGEGLRLPELSVLLSWTKIVLADVLLATDLPDDPYLRGLLYGYFPTPMRHRFREQMDAHPLRREIVVTEVVNRLVNTAGMTFWARLAEETGASADELARARFVADEIFGAAELREEIASYDNRISATAQGRMRIELRTLVERAARWLVLRRSETDAEGVVDFFGVRIQQVLRAEVGIAGLLSGRDLEAYEARRASYVEDGVPEELAARVAALPPSYALLSAVETAARHEGVETETVARVHFALGERLGLSSLLARILVLPRTDRWQQAARAALRDDLHAVHAQLTAQVVDATSADDPAPARVAAWEETQAAVVARAATVLEEVCTEEADLARVSVGMRVVRGLAAAPDSPI